MDAGWAMVVAAAVSTVGAVMVALLQRFRKENARDHEVVTGMLKILHRAVQRTEIKLDKVDDRLTNHIESHHQN
jgi:low affinity Fe/Cu permease